MEDQQSQSLKDRAWTTDEIRKHSANWSLAGDVGLFNLLSEFSHYIISRTHEVENAVDSLVHQTKMTSAKINNIINDFHMLSNLQFVENRVYDEEIQESVSENKPVVDKTKEQREVEMLPKIMQAIELGLGVLDAAFDRINVNEISDSEDEEDISSEGRTILEPKDPYEQRPLPYVIGSEQFMKCDYAGLKDLIEDDVQSFSEESSISETDETSSDEAEPIPLDDAFEKQTDQFSQNISDKISSSDESELFGSEQEVNGFASDTSLDINAKEKNIQKLPADAKPEKETCQNSVSSLQSKLKLPQVLPVPKLSEKKKDDDLFTNEDEPSDDESPFRRKTGLFSSDVRFDDDDDKDGDLFQSGLFGKSPSKDVKEHKPVEVPKASKEPQVTAVSDKKKPVLFDNDEDSEDDIFNTLMKTNRPTPAKTSNAGSQDSSEKADTSSTPSSAPSTKPSGNAFDFVTGGGGNNDSLFADDSDGDDLFSSKKTQGKKFDFDTSENDDLFGIISSKPAQAPKETKSLFEDNKVLEQPKKKEPQKSLLVKKKTKDSIFEDSDSSDQEKKIPAKSPLSAPVKSKSKKEISLFDDDDFDDDIFSQTKKKSEAAKPKKEEQKASLFEDDSLQIKKKPEAAKPKKEEEKSSLFEDDSLQIKKKPEVAKPKKEEEKSSLFEDDSLQIGKKETKTVKVAEKSKTLSLFDDMEENEKPSFKPMTKDISVEPSLFEGDIKKEPPKSFPTVPKPEQKKTLSLFEDSDNFDLFAPKPPTKKSEPPLPVEVPKPASSKPATVDKNIAAVPPKVSSSAKDISIDSQVSFDSPVDSSNVLNVISKSRVKVTAKRRKPTRQGRLAALENSEKEATQSHVESTPTISSLDPVGDSPDSSFTNVATKPSAEVTKPTVEPNKFNYKAQEKKKMNLMSQLISEVATSKVGLRKAEEKDDEDDDVDIFSEAAKKDRSKSSFSFRPPEENGIASMFPVEKEKEKNEDLSVSNSDSFDDDFFTEPSFQNFRSSISRKDPPVLNFEDDDDDDDLFSSVKSNLPKPKPEAADSNDLFDDDTDIFADIQKEKYEMFPTQIYDDEDDDIFGNMSNTVGSKPSSSTASKTTNSSVVKKAEKQQVNAFDDPLTGLLGDD